MSRKVDPVLTDRRRADLIKAGYAEIVEKGLEETTIDSVVARAGSSKGGALYYFPTKDDLLYAVLEWLLNQLSRTLDEVVRSRDTPRSRLAAELEVLFHSADVNRKLYLVLFDFVALGSRHERFGTLLGEFFRTCRTRDIAIVTAGIKEQQFRRVNPDDAAATIRALVDGYCLQWLLGSESVPVEVYRDRCRAVLGSYLLR